MTIMLRSAKYVPQPIKAALRPISNRFFGKYDAEMAYWQDRFRAERETFSNDHYERIMLQMAEEPNGNFLLDKIVGDFGCGPRGSLAWAKQAKLRMGIDVLADRYVDAFTSNCLAHDMVYLKSTEKTIPVPDEFLDVLFTLNAIDHVDHFTVICAELLRILKPGGLFIGSFNLEEPATPYEPQQLTEAMIQKDLLAHISVLSYRISAKGTEDVYAPFFSGELHYSPGEEGFLWVKGRKPDK